MHQPLAALLFGLVLTSPLSAATWPQDNSDLKPDAKAQFGTLENGLRYVILPHDEPPGRASIRLYMDVGSLMEKDDQQGMAHYLEHMAFNGSRHFKGGEMVEYFQRLGMGFGADTNAHTSFRETVYMLELPKVEPKFITEGMQLFRDYLDGMLLGESEIDKERGIILSEKLSRDSIEYRTMIAGYKFALPESLLPQRMPIGTEEMIKTMKRPRFVDFYEGYYNPKRATIVAVGDFKDPAAVKAEIEKQFADAKPQREDAKDPDLGKVSSGYGLIAKLHTEMQAEALTISIEIPRPAENKPDTAATRLEMTTRDLADMMINQRLSKLAKAEGAPFISAESYSYEYLEFVNINGIQGQCDPKNWQATLTLLETELRRAIEHGFTDAEFEEAKATVLKGAKLRADQADSRKSRDLASTFVSSLAGKRVFTHPADDFARISSTLATLKKEECHAALVDDWKGTDTQIFLGGNLKLEGDAAQQIITTFKESRAKPVAPPAKEETAAFAYTDFGPAGKVVKRTEVKDLEILQAVFENNVRFNFKHTEFEKGTLRVLINFGGGKLVAPTDKPGLIPFAQSTFQLGGLEKHGVDELRRIFASRTVGSDFTVGDEAFLLSGRTTPADLDAQLQLLTAYLVAPGYRDEAARQFEKNIDPLYTQLNHTAEGVMNNDVVAFMHSGDPRWGFPKMEELKKRSLAELKEWLTPALKESYLEVTVLGDTDAETALNAVARTLGALPKRAEKKPAYEKERAVAFPKPDASKSFPFETEIPKAIATIYWNTTDMLNIQRARRLTLLGSILDDRLRIKIREELGDTYSPACYHVASDTFTGYGYVTAMIECKPEQAAKLTKLVVEIGDTLSSGEISDDEFDRAIKPTLAQLEQMRRDNRYWSMNVLRCSQEHPERLDWARSFVSDFSGIKKDEISALAKEYLGAKRAVTADIMPVVKK
ncbi:MAG: insulinase family protein [Prosthecobacter sp.]|jgi:zinc protease|uniref:M16 family metallopeptidase n=1 Tax=Prosthecobacter sp. TaxID=1965333 RepID=UPI001A06BADE|nr:insulinase family protein [Prosthecobacter sp.]MBE2286912.1 insulinase family protein [Prosthecobacter sp.]